MEKTMMVTVTPQIRKCPRCKKQHTKIPRECLSSHYEKTLAKMFEYCAQNEKWTQQLLNEPWN